jgi:hypothetical protein
MAQMPPWCQRGDPSDFSGEIVDDGGWLENDESKPGNLDKPSWSMFVAEEIEKFEQRYAGEYRSTNEWSSIWRKGWWPRVSARKRFPKSAPKEFQPFFRKGTPEFARALKYATEDEKRMWIRFGIAQFKADDPRLKNIQLQKQEAAE